MSSTSQREFSATEHETLLNLASNSIQRGLAGKTSRLVESIEAEELWTLEMDNKWELAELGCTSSKHFGIMTA